MNLRQKAKRFKRLYENELFLKKPYPVKYEMHNAKHYRVQFATHEAEILCAQQELNLYETQVVNGILNELRPIVRDNLKTERDLYIGKFIYSLDIWV